MTAAEQDALSRQIWRWGLFVVFIVVLKLVLSFGSASFAPLGLRESHELAMLTRLAYFIPAPAGFQEMLQDYFTGSSFLTEEWVRGVLHGGTSLLLLVAFLAVMRATIQADHVSDQSQRYLFRFALAIALIQMLSYPVFTTDFWLSIAWGRMIVDGQNPYYTDMTAAALNGLPIGNWGDRMTYGPLWGVVSAALTWLAGRREWLEFILFKGILTTAWIGSLVMLRTIASRISTREIAIVTCLYGWSPMSSQMALAEGHNDIALIAPMVLWLLLLLRGPLWGATPSLVGSIVIKYVSAPLLALDVIAQRVLHRVTLRRYLTALVPSVIMAASLFLLFAHDRHFLNAADQMRSWTFWTPSTALLELSEELGFQVPGRWVNFGVALGCVVLVAFYLKRFIQARTIQRFFGLVLAAVLTVLFTVVGHVWPWFMLWALPAAVLTWRSPLAWFVLSLAAFTPFLNLHWLIGTNWNLRPVSGLLYYAFGLLVTVWLFAHYRLDRVRTVYR
jgi:hypothetical protein